MIYASLVVYVCVCAGCLISNIHIFVGKIDWMHVSHVFMALCSRISLSFMVMFWKRNNLLYIFLFLFVLLGNKGMSKIRFDECIMTILNHFINCISFFRQMARMDNFTNVWVDIYVFNFVLDREWGVVNVQGNQKWLTISHSQLGILTDYKFKLLK